MQHSGQQELRGDIISVEPTTAGTFGQEITEVYAPPAVKQVKKRIRGTGMFYHANENGELCFMFVVNSGIDKGRFY